MFNIQSIKKGRKPIGPYLLDMVSSTVMGAYSLRYLRQAYTGPLVRLRRASDNSEQDFGGNLQTAFQWAGGSTLYGVTWYDQSGNGYHLTQASTSLQPIFAPFGDFNSIRKWFFRLNDGSSRRFSVTTATPNGYSNMMLNAVGAAVGSGTSGTFNVDRAVIYYAQSGSWGTIAMSLLAAEVAWRFGTGQASNTNTRSRTSSNYLTSATAIKRTSNEFAYVNGTQLGATATGKNSPTSTNGSVLDVGFGDSSNVPEMQCCEVIVFTSAVAGDEDIIWGNQNAYYRIV